MDLGQNSGKLGKQPETICGIRESREAHNIGDTISLFVTEREMAKLGIHFGIGIMVTGQLDRI